LFTHILLSSKCLGCCILVLTLLFSTTYHPQIDCQIEVINRTLSQISRYMLYKILKEWETHVPYIEFVYNRVIHSTTSHSPFEIIYGFNPLTHLDIFSLPTPKDMTCSDANVKVNFIEEQHVIVKSEIKRKVEKYASNTNKGIKRVVFQPRDWVWVYFDK